MRLQHPAGWPLLLFSQNVTLKVAPILSVCVFWYVLFSPGNHQRQTPEGQLTRCSPPRRNSSWVESRPSSPFSPCSRAEARGSGSIRGADMAPDAPRRFHSSAGRRRKNPALSVLWQGRHCPEHQAAPAQYTPPPVVKPPPSPATGMSAATTGRSSLVGRPARLTSHSEQGTLGLVPDYRGPLRARSPCPPVGRCSPAASDRSCPRGRAPRLPRCSWEACSCGSCSSGCWFHPGCPSGGRGEEVTGGEEKNVQPTGDLNKNRGGAERTGWASSPLAAGGWCRWCVASGWVAGNSLLFWRQHKDGKKFRPQRDYDQSGTYRNCKTSRAWRPLTSCSVEWCQTWW